MASVELLTLMACASVFTLCLIIIVVFVTQQRRGDAIILKLDEQIRAI